MARVSYILKNIQIVPTTKHGNVQWHFIYNTIKNCNFINKESQDTNFEHAKNTKGLFNVPIYTNYDGKVVNNGDAGGGDENGTPHVK
jgi:hypothetical protein